MSTPTSMLIKIVKDACYIALLAPMVTPAINVSKDFTTTVLQTNALVENKFYLNIFRMYAYLHYMR
jgi:hypothetical protein